MSEPPIEGAAAGAGATGRGAGTAGLGAGAVGAGAAGRGAAAAGTGAGRCGAAWGATWGAPFADSATMLMTPPHTEQRARMPAEGTFAGSTRNMDRHSGHVTFILFLPR